MCQIIVTIKLEELLYRYCRHQVPSRFQSQPLGAAANVAMTCVSCRFPLTTFRESAIMHLQNPAKMAFIDGQGPLCVHAYSIDSNIDMSQVSKRLLSFVNFCEKNMEEMYVGSTRGLDRTNYLVAALQQTLKVLSFVDAISFSDLKDTHHPETFAVGTCFCRPYPD